jgi:tight adherence protein B
VTLSLSLSLSSPLVMVGGGAVVLVGLAIVLMVLDGGRKAKQKRIDTLLKAYAPSAGRGENRVARSATTAAPSTTDSSNMVTRLFAVRLDQGDLYPAPWWVIMLAVGALSTAASALLAAVFGPLAWGTQPVIWIFVARALFGMFASRRARVLYTQMPDALSMIVRSVRTGIPVPESLRIVGKEAQAPTAIEFEKLYNQLLIGQSLTEALISMAKRTEVAEYRFFAVALSLQGQTGGSLTDTLENLADVIRKRTAMRARAYALSAEARTTMLVLASLPFVAFLGMLLLEPAYVMVLFNKARGRQILAVAVMMLTMGIGAMQFMIRRALS